VQKNSGNVRVRAAPFFWKVRGGFELDQIEREFQRRKRMLDHTKTSVNAALTCRYFGIGRSSPVILGFFGVVRPRTMSCCRSTIILTSSDVLVLANNRMADSNNLIALVIAPDDDTMHCPVL
jgi:hypothetical protein